MWTFFATITPSLAEVIRAAARLFSSLEAERIIAGRIHKWIVRLEALAHSDVLAFATVFGWNVPVLANTLVVSKLIDTLSGSTWVFSSGAFVDVDTVSSSAVELISFWAVTVVTSIQVSAVASFARTSHGGTLVDVFWHKSNAVRFPTRTKGAKLEMFRRADSRAYFTRAFNCVLNLGPTKASTRATALCSSSIWSNQIRADSIFNLGVAVTLSKVDTSTASGNVSVIRRTFAGERSDRISALSTKTNA